MHYHHGMWSAMTAENEKIIEYIEGALKKKTKEQMVGYLEQLLQFTRDHMAIADDLRQDVYDMLYPADRSKYDIPGAYVTYVRPVWLKKRDNYVRHKWAKGMDSKKEVA